LGSHDLEIFNEVMLVEHFWRLLQ